MIDEARLCLAEGVVRSPDDIDFALLSGAGFPAFRGGLMRYAEQMPPHVSTNPVIPSAAKNPIEASRRAVLASVPVDDPSLSLRSVTSLRSE
jgi:hypothetical protein